MSVYERLKNYIKESAEAKDQQKQSVVFIDAEIGVMDHKIYDLGAVSDEHGYFHSAVIRDFIEFIEKHEYVCGHNIIHHDLKYINISLPCIAVDTLYLSPLLFPKRPYHALLKDDKLQADQLNDPVNDCKKAESLFYDEINAFAALPENLKLIYSGLLRGQPEFTGFFSYLGFEKSPSAVEQLIKSEFDGKICVNADIKQMISEHPAELAYALALIGTDDSHSVTPPWLLKTYPQLSDVIRRLREVPCTDGCEYCRSSLDVHKGLKYFFGYDSFRTYNGEPLQEKAIQAAVNGKSVLAVFPTGGGKSLTFQLPALMAGRASRGLTVVLSPLQSLMKDQVDNLKENGISEAAAINGLLNPVERSAALERVENGSVHILYISPEQLRSRTIERLLLSRNIARFVIDEAHCFSAWGQDFRVDYLYIGKFIRELQEKKNDQKRIPVSCFTATAKQKVISDICDYFNMKLDLDLEIFASSAARENLRYRVLYKETDEEKYAELRRLIAAKSCPTIVYVSRTGQTERIAAKLRNDGFSAKPFHGKMDPNEKVINQDAFIKNEIQVMVATSAFGMGVDKKDIRLVIHYDISGSLEDYVQEAGRAGRDPSIDAECYILYNDNDLDKHFVMLNQTKLSISEIQQVWKAIKDLTRHRPSVCCSPLEIARQAGWNDSAYGIDFETRVKTAIAALESAGYVERGKNMPRVYANSINAENFMEASLRIDRTELFSSEDERETAKRIIKSLIAKRSRAGNIPDEAESRIDYIADRLGLTKQAVIGSVNRMRQEGLLGDFTDMSAYISTADSENKSLRKLKQFKKLERFLLKQLPPDGIETNLKELNENAVSEGIAFSEVKNLRTLIYFLVVKNYIRKSGYSYKDNIQLIPKDDISRLMQRHQLRCDICENILSYLFRKAAAAPVSANGEKLVEYSEVELYREYEATPRMMPVKISLTDIEEALLYLLEIKALKLEGGFLVLYYSMQLRRTVKDNRIKYKKEDYRMLDEFYRQKICQIHIVGKYANLVVRDNQAALQYVQDYFQMDHKRFIRKYFSEDQIKYLERNITRKKYNELFGELSDVQMNIINDSDSRCIVVAAGPGSGKTRVLVHKLASLLILEDIKQEQLLMLTFSRAAAVEFKKRLIALIGKAAYFVEIKTFHSFCFDVLGRIGSLENSETVVKRAVELLQKDEAEQGKVTKSVLVIDEAQDMDENSFALVRELMRCNEYMRVIAVGDDDQNIYEFRNSNSRYMRELIDVYGAKSYEMTKNYRSAPNITALGNRFIASAKSRMKSVPIEAVSNDIGIVKIVHHKGRYMEEAVADHILANHKRERCCVLTNTNDEALIILGLLLKNGIRAKLIQSVKGFRLYNLSEIRYFLKKLSQADISPIIPDEAWQTAKQQLYSRYDGSPCLEICKNLIKKFEETNIKKYRTDLEEFIYESNYEDFYDDDRETVVVSTIHKAKGREFDAVYLMLNGNTAATDEEKRKLYVGMTRAKKELYIHSNTSLFYGYNLPGVEHIWDSRRYAEPSCLTMQLVHSDVVLDFFIDKKNLTHKLRSGMPLYYHNTYLSADWNGGRTVVAKLSRACQERVEKLQTRGYALQSAVIRFIVAWKKDDEEIPVILPDLHFERMR